MKKLLRKLEAAMTAVAFAEEGDAETARRIMAEVGRDEAGETREDKPTLLPIRQGTRLAKRSTA
jgi:hypothetical protein